MAQRPKKRPHKIYLEALRADIKTPYNLLRERARELDAWINAIWRRCRHLKMTYKI